MKFTRLVPTIFYADIQTGLNLFVNCLGFHIIYNELESAQQPFCVIENNPLKLHLIQDRAFAMKDRPEIRMETENIDAVYSKVKDSYSNLLHPNLNKITLQPWYT